jgi:hypothetical protein
MLRASCQCYCPFLPTFYPVFGVTSPLYIIHHEMASPQSKRAKPEISVLTKDDVHTDKYPSLSSPLTPLTPLREDIVADHWAESDDKWQRCAETGYRLPGESEKALVGPLYPGECIHRCMNSCINMQRQRDRK